MSLGEQELITLLAHLSSLGEEELITLLEHLGSLGEQEPNTLLEHPSSLGEQELITLLEHLSSFPFFVCRIRVARSFGFCVIFYRSLFAIFLFLSGHCFSRVRVAQNLSSYCFVDYCCQLHSPFISD